MKLGTFEELVQFLKDFRSWENQSEGYDCVGVMHLLGACLDNLRQNASRSDLAELSDCLEAHHIAFLKKLVSGL